MTNTLLDRDGEPYQGLNPREAPMDLILGYRVTGPVPSYDSPDVMRVRDICRDNQHPFTRHAGLIMVCGSGGTYLRFAERFIVMFREVRGQHRFTEASGVLTVIKDLFEFQEFMEANRS